MVCSNTRILTWYYAGTLLHMSVPPEESTSLKFSPNESESWRAFEESSSFPFLSKWFCTYSNILVVHYRGYINVGKSRVSCSWLVVFFHFSQKGSSDWSIPLQCMLPPHISLNGKDIASIHSGLNCACNRTMFLQSGVKSLGTLLNHAQTRCFGWGGADCYAYLSWSKSRRARPYFTLSRSYCVFVYIFHVLIFSHFYITSQQSHFEDVNSSREL